MSRKMISDGSLAAMIGERILGIRTYLDLSQRKFGKLLGIKGQYVSQLEKGMRHPSELLILSICGTFSVNRSWLEKGEGEMHDPGLAKWTGTPGRPHEEQSETQIIHSVVDSILREGDIVKHTAINALLEILQQGDLEQIKALSILLLRLSHREDGTSAEGKK
jgi:transcriptional regulator with XRE-family HTH domain